MTTYGPFLPARAGLRTLPALKSRSGASAMLDGVSSWHLNSAQEFTKVQNKIMILSRQRQRSVFANVY